MLKEVRENGDVQNAKLGFFKLVKIISRESISSTPWVFKEFTFKFSIFWIPIALLILYYCKSFFDFEASPPLASLVTYGLHFIAGCFTIFIVPYFVFVFLHKEGKLEFSGELSESLTQKSQFKFKDFLTENIFPLVINKIKAVFILFAYFLLPIIFLVVVRIAKLSLIVEILAYFFFIPGIIKFFRFAFITQATFFDEDYKQGKISALKASHNTTKGYLFLILAILIFLICFSFIFGFIWGLFWAF